jgi:PTH1 family peptidyl-tRNA hydrolase
MKLVVGLGNPGDKYQATRHNAGFWLVERLAAQSGTVLRKDGKFQALVGRHEASGAWLVLPQSYMNSSGRPVQMMASFFKIDPADILIIHDELDLRPGTAKLKQGGGIAGHNGLKDISARLGSHEYWRLRLGIGRPADRQAGADFVLNRPAPDERTAIDAAIERSLEVMPLVLAGDLQGAMLKLHTQEQETASAPPDRVATAEPARQVEKASSIEKFGVVQAAQYGKADKSDKVEKLEQAQAQKAEGSQKVEEPAQAERKGTLNSLLKKFLPGTDPARKK